jgi:ERCC4-type nuclease
MARFGLNSDGCDELRGFPYVLIEGADLDDGPLSSASVRGVCIALSDLGVAVLRSTDVQDSALWLLRLAERRAAHRFRNRPAYAQRPKSETGVPAAEAALASVPGVSTITARALLTHFETLAAVAAADEAAWQLVPGIGPTRAKALTSTFRTPHPSSHSRRSRE